MLNTINNLLSIICSIITITGACFKILEWIKDYIKKSMRIKYTMIKSQFGIPWN